MQVVDFTAVRMPRCLIIGLEYATKNVTICMRFTPISTPSLGLFVVAVHVAHLAAKSSRTHGHWKTTRSNPSKPRSSQTAVSADKHPHHRSTLRDCMSFLIAAEKYRGCTKEPLPHRQILPGRTALRRCAGFPM